MRDVKFAVVIPAYNAQDYLPEMYKTLLEQTYKNFLVITIDDCSQDKTGDIADEYVEIFHQAGIDMVAHHKTVNEGLSAARNTGIDIAIYAGNCDYILFLDADDTVSVELLATLVEKITGANAVQESEIDNHDDFMRNAPDMLIYGFSEDYYSEHGELTFSREIHTDEAYLTRHKKSDEAQVLDFVKDNRAYMTMLAELEANTMLGYAWNKAYKLALFDRYNLIFEVVMHIEDIVFNLAFLEHATSLCVVDEILYHYRNANQVRLTAKVLPNYMRLQKRRVYEFMRLQNHVAEDSAGMKRDSVGEAEIPERVYQVAAGVYFRSLESMIVREISQKKNKRDIIEMVESELVDELYTVNGKNLYLLLRGHLPESKTAELLYKPLAQGKINKAYRNACIIGFVQKHFSGLYAKLKQQR